jgi:hypothetical protein
LFTFPSGNKYSYGGSWQNDSPIIFSLSPIWISQ